MNLRDAVQIIRERKRHTCRCKKKTLGLPQVNKKELMSLEEMGHQYGLLEESGNVVFITSPHEIRDKEESLTIMYKVFNIEKKAFCYWDEEVIEHVWPQY